MLYLSICSGNRWGMGRSKLIIIHSSVSRWLLLGLLLTLCFWLGYELHIILSGQILRYASLASFDLNLLLNTYLGVGALHYFFFGGTADDAETLAVIDEWTGSILRRYPPSKAQRVAAVCLPELSVSTLACILVFTCTITHTHTHASSSALFLTVRSSCMYVIRGSPNQLLIRRALWHQFSFFMYVKMLISFISPDQAF